MAKPSVLLIDRGDLPSLAALCLEGDPGRVLLWHPLEEDASSAPRLAAVRNHAEQLGAAGVIPAGVPALGLGDVALRSSLARAVLLVTGAAAAAELGCRRLVWPIAVGGALEAMEAEIDRANMVTALLVLGADRSDVELDLPLVDLTDTQILDLATDRGLIEDGFWPCERGLEAACEDCASCVRWQTACTTSGVNWPWAAAVVA